MPDKRFANKRSPIQRARDELTIAELNLKGWTQQAIADHLELDISLISRTLKKIKEQWAKEKLDSIELAIKRECKKLDMLEAENWKAWERSQGVRTLTLSERLATGLDDTGKPIGRLKTATRTEQAIGDSQFLTELRRIVETRCKLQGLNPATEVKILEVAETMASNQLNLFFEMLSADSEIPKELIHRMITIASQLQERQSVAGEN